MPDLLERLAADVGGRYMFEGELGRGGMATVYLARDVRDERRVAVKVMDPELAAAVGAERFRREIAVVSRLSHPNILGILDNGEAAGTSYYVMPYVAGETLRDRLKRETQLPVEDALRIAREVADALDHAHREGVIHRDIKPENILLEDGHALVADFGIARAVGSADATALTKTGVAIGTPHYMSPEQIYGQKDLDGRTDQYALSCMLYEMLVGQPPFEGASAHVLMVKHAMDEPPLATRYRQGTPQNVEDAILTGLAKVPADRFATLGDFSRALGNSGYTSQMRATRAQPAGTAPVLVDARPRWRRALPIAIALGLGAVAIAGGARYWKPLTGAQQSDPALSAELSRVAVLYFEADGDGDLPAFADAITEGLIIRLGEVDALRVVSRNGVLPYRGQEDSPATVASALDVGTLVTGTIRQEGRDYRLKVRLLDKTGDEIADFSIKQPVDSAFALRDDVAERVARELRNLVGKKVQLTRLRSGTTNLQAWTLLQRAERARRDADSLMRAGNEAAAPAMLTRAEDVFRDAGRLDAAWTAPLLGRAHVAMLRVELADRDPAVAAPWLDSTEALATAALTVDTASAEAFALRGTARARRVLMQLAEGDEARALREMADADLNTATALDRTLASAWNVRGELQYAAKNVQKALLYSQAAYKADAYLAEAPRILNRLFQASYDLDDLQNAQRYCLEGAQRFPQQSRFLYCRLLLQTMPEAKPDAAQTWRLVDSLMLGVPAAAQASVRRELQMFGAVAMLRAGLGDSATRTFERARAGRPPDPKGELMALEAFALTQFGEKEEAIGLLERYVSRHPEHISGFDKGDFWWWRPLKDDPRFETILTLAKAAR